MNVGILWPGMVVAAFACNTFAQSSCPDDPVIDQIRVLSSIGEGDQSRIARWIGRQIDSLETAAKKDPNDARARFRSCLTEQYGNTRNTTQFRTVLAEQMTKAAADRLGRAGLNGSVSRALARVLVDMDRAETHEGLLAGLKSKVPATRFLCARGLALRRSDVANDDAKLTETIKALRNAGDAETDTVVLAALYSALAYSGSVSAVFDAYMAMFDKRLEYRRGTAVYADRAEVDAFDFFRQSGVIDALTAEQKAGLVRRLAVFLRLDAERYIADDLQFDEREILERRLDGEEACLELIVGRGSGGGNLRKDLKDGGFARREAILREAYRWVGHPTTQQAGALNGSPWNVPIAAP